jgi:hypothetical protein
MSSLAAGVLRLAVFSYFVACIWKVIPHGTQVVEMKRFSILAGNNYRALIRERLITLLDGMALEETHVEHVVGRRHDVGWVVD